MLKKQILKELLSASERYISGQALSRKLGISRTAVWKNIELLRKDGYTIKAVSNKGYRLTDMPDLLMPDEIMCVIKTSRIGKNIIYRQRVDSTNNLAKRIAINEQDGTVVIAEEQTYGRGRMGRTWLSPAGVGIWMSIILKPELSPARIYQVTQAAAVAVARSITKFCNVKAGIKWPNDIIVNGKKVCGILTEMNAEQDRVNFLVIGIGVNVNTAEDDIPDDLKAKATSLRQELGSMVSRKGLVINMLEQLDDVYSIFINQGFKGIIDECKSLSVTLGREVIVTQAGHELTGSAVDIGYDGKLKVETADGMVEIISGDVSVRGLQGYI